MFLPIPFQSLILIITITFFFSTTYTSAFYFTRSLAAIDPESKAERVCNENRDHTNKSCSHIHTLIFYLVNVTKCLNLDYGILDNPYWPKNNNILNFCSPKNFKNGSPCNAHLLYSDQEWCKIAVHWFLDTRVGCKRINIFKCWNVIKSSSNIERQSKCVYRHGEEERIENWYSANRLYVQLTLT